MAYDSIIQTGSFVSTGYAKTLNLRSDVDKVVVENVSQWAAQTQDHAFRFTWYKGMSTKALMEYHDANSENSSVDESEFGAIQYYNSAEYELGPAVAITGGTNATQPVYSTGSTLNLFEDSIVRVTGTDQLSLNGLDFSVGTVNAGADFELGNALATAPGVIAGANGHWRLVAPSLEFYNLFSPSLRNISDISQAAEAVITTLVDHNFKPGQLIKFKVPDIYGMTELDGLVGEVQATGLLAYQFKVNIDTTGFTAFKFPVNTDQHIDPANVVSAGQAKGGFVDLAPNKIHNKGLVAIILGGGALMPAGIATDKIRWTAYKSFNR